MLLTILLPPPKTECQLKVNNFWSSILDNLRATERRWRIINSSNTFMGKNATDDIASASYNWAPTEFQQDTSNRYLKLGFVSALIPWTAISNLELRRSYRELRDDLVLPSATTLSNICQRQYALTVDAIEKQLPSPIEVSSSLDRWTSPNKLAMTSVIA